MADIQEQEEPAVETCHCESRKGFTGLPQEDGTVLWVCANEGCHKPTQGLVDGMKKLKERWG